ncbi:uncharacterized protein LOC134273758 [Saccostrea cucullata]|uniref:uncharacterized protein LOC134273758 n=1 Tax=Saccostrea cuccullata TaxID=36930 RepID=UPI002ED6B4E7
MIVFCMLMIGLLTGKGVFPVKYPMTDNPVIKDGKRSGESECNEALRKDPPHCATNYWFYCNTDRQGECLHSCMDFACQNLHPPVWTTPYTTSYLESPSSSSSSSTSLQSPESKRPNTDLTVTLSALTTPTACNDSPSANCSLYNATVICDLHGAYYLWARKHCPLFCGFCHVVTCNDNPSANCALYNSTAICDVNGPYYTWARRNCEKTRGFCQGNNLTIQLYPENGFFSKDALQVQMYFYLPFYVKKNNFLLKGTNKESDDSGIIFICAD